MRESESVDGGGGGDEQQGVFAVHARRHSPGQHRPVRTKLESHTRITAHQTTVHTLLFQQQLALFATPLTTPYLNEKLIFSHERAKPIP